MKLTKEDLKNLVKEVFSEVSEELTGDQDELDVAEPKGKLTKADFDALKKNENAGTTALRSLFEQPVPATDYVDPEFAARQQAYSAGQAAVENAKMAALAMRAQEEEEAPPEGLQEQDLDPYGNPEDEQATRDAAGRYGMSVPSAGGYSQFSPQAQQFGDEYTRHDRPEPDVGEGHPSHPRWTPIRQARAAEWFDRVGQPGELRGRDIGGLNIGDNEPWETRQHRATPPGNTVRRDIFGLPKPGPSYPVPGRPGWSVEPDPDPDRTIAPAYGSRPPNRFCPANPARRLARTILRAKR